MSDDFDVREIIKYLSPRNITLWVLVLAWAAVAFIAVVWFAVYAWGHNG